MTTAKPGWMLMMAGVAAMFAGLYIEPVRDRAYRKWESENPEAGPEEAWAAACAWADGQQAAVREYARLGRRLERELLRVIFDDARQRCPDLPPIALGVYVSNLVQAIRERDPALVQSILEAQRLERVAQSARSELPESLPMWRRGKRARARV